MKIVEQSYEILYPATTQEWEREFKLIELAGRTAYKSEGKISEFSFLPFIEVIKKRGHGAVLEFGNMVVKFITDRGITHEIVRHRICSFLQESTRYCNYGQDKFNNEVTFIKPGDMGNCYGFEDYCKAAELAYLGLIDAGKSPQVARSVLPTCTKTEIIVKANFREWKHIFDLRVLGKSGAPHPDMKRLVEPLYTWLVDCYPFIWAEVANGGA